MLNLGTRGTSVKAKYNPDAKEIELELFLLQPDCFDRVYTKSYEATSNCRVYTKSWLLYAVYQS